MKTIRTRLKTMQLKNKDSATSKTTIRSTCRNRKSPPKDNKCSQLLSSPKKTRFDWTIWEQTHNNWKTCWEWRKSCPVTFCWRVRESMKPTMRTVMMMKRRTSMRWLTSCRKVDRSKRQNSKALKSKAWRPTGPIPLMKTASTSKSVNQSKASVPGLISLKISKIPLAPRSHLTAI